MSTTPIKTAILSFGLSGKVFHAPFIHIDPRFELCGIWERSKSESLLSYPGIRIYRSLEEVLNDDTIELVIVNTPTGTHYEYARKALEAGKHVVVEKAFTTTIAEAISLNLIAKERKLVLSVYQNRRWDSDFKTVEQVIKHGWLGDILEASFHFDRYKEQLSPKAHKEMAAPGTGLLNDLGPHIIDQALYLFGMPESLFAHIRTLRTGSLVDDDFSITLFYPNLRVELKSGLLIREAVPAYVLHGRKGSFLKSRADIQEDTLLRGAIPTGSEWGIEPAQEAGLLHTEMDGNIVRKHIPSLPGNYGDYYAGIYQSIRAGEPVKVSAEDGIRCMTIIELARESSVRQELIRIPQ
jgi:predicted dehydrogenase